MRLSLVTAPSLEPLALADAKLHLHEEVSDNEDLITRLIAAARRHAEFITNRQLITATWDLKRDEFPATLIEMPRPPLQSVTSITYVDSAGVTQTWASAKYQVDAPSGPTAARGRIMPAYTEVYPSTRTDTFNAVVVRFIAGYGLAVAVPEDIKVAMLLMIGHWFAQREAVNIGNIVNEVPMGARSLLTPYVSRPVCYD